MKSLRLLCFLIIAYSGAFAQVGFGPEAGLGISTFKFAPPTAPIDYTAATASAIFGFRIGGVVDVPLNRHIFFQTGILLTRKGCNRQFSYYRNDSFNETVQQTLSLYYVDVPLTIIYKTGMQGKGRFTFGLGAEPSYVLWGRNKLQDAGFYGGTSINSNGTYPVTAGETVHGFDVGVNLSAGYELPTGLFFKLCYINGVNDIGVGSETDKNRTFVVAAGYLFGNGRNINKEAGDLIDKGDGK